MIQLSSKSKILMAMVPVDFRRGIDGLVGLCRNVLDQNPASGTVFVFSNRSRTQIRLLYYDGSGYWLMTKRLSRGRFPLWPQTKKSIEPCEAKHLIVLLWGENPGTDPRLWKKVS